MGASAPHCMEAEEYCSQQKYLLVGPSSSSHSTVQFLAFCSFSLMEANMDLP